VLGRVESAGPAVEDAAGEPLVRDPSGNALLLTLA
jgi:hypothetical protein